jgi:branched-chain amino acid transport system substrate-binding protein
MLVCATVAALGLAACSSSGGATGSADAPAATGGGAAATSGGSGAGNDTPIKIEVVAPFSGAEGYLGQPTMNGIELALKDVGGVVAGRKVDLVKADDACTPATAVQLIRKFADDSSVSAVFGPICSGSMAAVQKTMAQDNMVHVTNGYGATLTTSGDNYIFVGVPNGTQLVQAMQPYIEQQHPQSAAVVQGNDGYSQQLADAEKKLLGTMGIKVAYNGTFDDSSTDYSGQISGIKNSGADIILIAAYEANGGALIKQLRQEGVTTPIGTPDACDPAATSVAGKYADNVGFAWNFCPTYPAFASFTSAYQAAYHGVPTDAVAGAYTAASALFAGLAKSGGQGGAALRSAMVGLTVQTKIGNLHYAQDGGLIEPTIVTGVMKNGAATFTSGQ